LFMLASPQALSAGTSVPRQDAIAVSATKNTSMNSETKDSASHQAYWQKVADPGVLAGWIGSIGTLAACFVGVFTLLKISKQTAANVVAANAAKESADLAANAERAWIITEVSVSFELPDFANQGGPTRSVMIVTFQNAGRSPAEIHRTQIVSLLIPSDLPLPDAPFYGEPDELPEVDAIQGEIIPAGDKRLVMSPIRGIALLNEEQKMKIKSGTMKLYCYGRIEYAVLSGVQRVTQFGYEYYVRRTAADNRPEAMYRVKGKEYNYTI